MVNGAGEECLRNAQVFSSYWHFPHHALLPLPSSPSLPFLSLSLSPALFPSPSPQAGMLAVRENRYIVLAKDFEKAYKTVIKKDEQEHEFYK